MFRPGLIDHAFELRLEGQVPLISPCGLARRMHKEGEGKSPTFPRKSAQVPAGFEPPTSLSRGFLSLYGHFSPLRNHC